MATCKECLHVEACKAIVTIINEATGLQINDDTETTIDADIECEYFTDRSRFVELPCKVGDTVYFDDAHLRYAKVIAIYIDAVGGMFGLEIFTNIETVNGYKSFICKDYTFEDIGKRLFLTKEEAEQALKERESK